MVRVSEITSALKIGLEQHIRRVYPVIQGPQRWGNMLEKRSTYFEHLSTGEGAAHRGDSKIQAW